MTIPYGCILKQIANLYPQAAGTICSGHNWIPAIRTIYRSYPAAGSVRDGNHWSLPVRIGEPQPEDDEEWDHKRYLSELTTAFELLRADPDVMLKN